LRSSAQQLRWQIGFFLIAILHIYCKSTTCAIGSTIAFDFLTSNSSQTQLSVCEMVNLNSNKVMISTLKKALIAGGCAVILTLGTSKVVAQGRGGNFDPAERRQRMMDGYKEALEVKDDAEWTALEPKVGKVVDARTEVMASTFRGFGGGGRNRQRGGGGGGGGNGDDQGNANNTGTAGQQRRPRGGGMFGPPSAAVEALQKAVDDKAPTAEIKEKLKAVQEEVKVKQAALAAAQEDLRGVLTPRQEAIATLRGLL
jgi:hypothetical protein